MFCSLKQLEFPYFLCYDFYIAELQVANKKNGVTDFMEQKRELGPIRVVITGHPHMLYETVELLRTVINRLPVLRLTTDGSYCLRAEELSELEQELTRNFDLSDKWMDFFFKAYPILDDSNTTTCLASCIAYSFFYIDTQHYTLKDHLDYIAKEWKELRHNGYQINLINRFSLGIEPLASREPIRLYEELHRLPISSDFCMLLYEAFSDLDFYIEKLYTLLLPVATFLETKFAQYEERTIPLLEKWVDFFADQPTVNAFLRRRTGTELPANFSELRIALRYFDCRMVVGSYLSDNAIAVMHIGVGVVPTLDHAPAIEQIDFEKEFAAFKLLGDKGRRDIIHILGQDALSMQEITNQLGLNSGTVFRNINSLFQAGLLSREIQGERFYYRAKISYIQSIFNHMMGYFQNTLEM